jgi:hypothetical protein
MVADPAGIHGGPFEIDNADFDSERFQETQERVEDLQLSGKLAGLSYDSRARFMDLQCLKKVWL